MDDLPTGAQLTFDTDSLIYYVEEHNRFLPVIEPVIEKVISRDLFGHAATITLTEVLVGPLRDGLPLLANEYRRLLRSGGNFRLHGLTRRTSERAAAIRARYNLQTPDAIIAATALEASCDYLITNDPVFRRVSELRALVLSDYLNA